MNYIRLLKPTQAQWMFRINSVKYFSQHPTKFLETQDKWRQKDGIPQKWQLIYKAPMGNVLNYAVAYLTTSAVIISASALYYAAFVFDLNSMDDPVLIGSDVVIANNAMECFIYLGAFIAFNAAVKILLSKFVIRLYNNGDKYIAIFRGNWFNSIVKHEFHLQEFEKLNPSFLISWNDARFKLGKKHGILLNNYFKTPEHLNYLLYKRKA